MTKLRNDEEKKLWKAYTKACGHGLLRHYTRQGLDEIFADMRGNAGG